MQNEVSYFLWFDIKLRPPAYWQHDHVYVSNTTHQALEIIQELGFPLIVALGRGSMELAIYLKHQQVVNMTYRLTCDAERQELYEIMNGNFIPQQRTG